MRQALLFLTLLVVATFVFVGGAASRSQKAVRVQLAVQGGSPTPAGIYRVDPGGKPVRLSNGRNDEFPAWSPDAKSIAFVQALKVGAPDRGCRLVVVPQAGGKSRPVPGVVSACRAISWGPGNLIAFNDLKGGVWVVKADGRGLRKILGPSTGGVGGAQTTLNPAWSPDGRTIAFGNGVAGGLYAVAADGRGLHQLTKPALPTGDGFPAWSPNGKKLAFVRSNPSDFSTSIAVARSDGGGVRRLLKVTQESDLARPAWTSDGSSIVFADVDGVSIVSAAGGSARLLVPGRYDQPAVAPTK